MPDATSQCHEFKMNIAYTDNRIATYMVHMRLEDSVQAYLANSFQNNLAVFFDLITEKYFAMRLTDVAAISLEQQYEDETDEHTSSN